MGAITPAKTPITASRKNALLSLIAPIERVIYGLPPKIAIINMVHTAS